MNTRNRLTVARKKEGRGLDEKRWGDYQRPYSESDLFSPGAASAFKEQNVILEWYKYNYCLTVKRELSAAAR